jgi:hypothetical protein
MTSGCCYSGIKKDNLPGIFPSCEDVSNNKVQLGASSFFTFNKMQLQVNWCSNFTQFLIRY